MVYSGRKIADPIFGRLFNEVNFSPLLGETDRARDANRALVAGLIEGDGRIPVEVFVGGPAALDVARRRLATAPPGHVLTSHAVTRDAGGSARPLAADGLFDRCLALLMDRGTTGLIAVAQTDEWLETGMPVDRMTALVACPSNPRFGQSRRYTFASPHACLRRSSHTDQWWS
jgi:cyanophycin synthetase